MNELIYILLKMSWEYSLVCHIRENNMIMIGITDKLTKNYYEDEIVIPECDNIIISDEKIFEQIFYNGINIKNIYGINIDCFSFSSLSRELLKNFTITTVITKSNNSINVTITIINIADPKLIKVIKQRKDVINFTLYKKLNKPYILSTLITELNITKTDYPYKVHCMSSSTYGEKTWYCGGETLYNYYNTHAINQRDTDWEYNYPGATNEKKELIPKYFFEKKLYYIKPVINDDNNFYKIICDIISFKKTDIICVCYGKHKYKLFSDANKQDYDKIEYLIVDSEPIFNEKYFIKMKEGNYEIYKYD
jgi:hypothetical protein